MRIRRVPGTGHESTCGSQPRQRPPLYNPYITLNSASLITSPPLSQSSDIVFSDARILLMFTCTGCICLEAMRTLQKHCINFFKIEDSLSKDRVSALQPH